MTDRILFYGTIAGLVVILSMIGMLVATGGAPEMTDMSVVYGYVTMLVALSSVFFGIRSHRDRALGGSIGFVAALFMGLGISAVAGAIYVLVWEVYLVATNFTFIGAYVDDYIAQQKVAGVSGAALQALVAEMETLKVQYANPLFRMPMTFLEIFPVGVLVSVISAAVLRRGAVASDKVGV
jgi:hypothetical protein